MAREDTDSDRDAHRSDSWHETSTYDSSVGGHAGDDPWAQALAALADTYEDAGDTDATEALYLRMLAWREGLAHYRAGIWVIADNLFKKSPEHNTVEDATWFLRSLRPDDGYAIPEVVSLLGLGFKGNGDMTVKAALAVWTLALRKKWRPKITEHGGLELVSKAVTENLNNPAIQAYGCGALRLLCCGHTYAERNCVVFINALAGAEVLTEAMRRHPSDHEVQREACGAIRATAEGQPSLARLLVDNNAVSLCLQAIVACPAEAVGDTACRALAALQCAAGSDTRTDEMTQNSGQKIAPQELDVLWEAELHKDADEGLQFCETHLQRHLNGGERSVLQALLGAVNVFVDDAGVRPMAVGLVEHVIRCMQSFPGNAKMQVPGCGILWRITAGHPSRESAVLSVAQNGGIGTVCLAMRDLPCNLELQRLAVGALKNLTADNNDHKTKGVKAGGIPACISAMLRYPKDARLQELAIGALTSLCDMDGRAATCARLGGIETIIAAMKRHADVGCIAEQGCIILCMFSADNLLRQQIVQSDGVSIAKMLSRADHGEAQKWGCELLRNLSDTHW